ncbi:MAG: TrkA C-terminal domain-containing protein [Halobacteriales archaeon]
MVASLPEQLLLGLYLGILTGILPGVVAWTLGFVFKYFTRVTIPALCVMAVAVALAGVQGGLLGLLDVEGVTQIVAVLVVMMIAMYCHSRGDRMGAEFPHRVTLQGLRDRTLSADVVKRVGRFGHVRLEVDRVVEMEGYAPVSQETKRRIEKGDWTFPAHLSVAELESRLAADLVDEFDLSDVSVSVDEDGRARVVAAPPVGGLSKRVPSGKRSVSFDVLVPSGVALGDEAEVDLGDTTVRGTVVSVRSGKKNEGTDRTHPSDVPPDETPAIRSAPTATGGEGRITVSFGRSEADAVLSNDPQRVLVRSRGSRREYELVSLLRSAGKVFEKVEVSSVEDDATVGGIDVRGTYGVVVLGIRHDGSRTVAPRGDEPVKRGDTLFVVGEGSDIKSLRGRLS